MTILLWIRTKRRLDTYSDAELEGLVERVRNPSPMEYLDFREPFDGDDVLLFGIDWLGTIQNLKAVVMPAMQADMIEDWSLTEVGRTLAALPIVEDADGEYVDWLDGRYEFQSEDHGLGALRWPRLQDERATATGLWIDLNRERQDRDRLIDALQKALPGHVERMWHARSSILLAYHSVHAFRQAAPMGLSPAVRKMLAGDEVAFWLTFQIGNWSVGGRVESLNGLANFIWRHWKQKRQIRHRNKSRAA